MRRGVRAPHRDPTIEDPTIKAIIAAAYVEDRVSASNRLPVTIFMGH